MRGLNQKKYKIKIMSSYFDNETLKDMLRIPKAAALNWIEEANHFFYKARPKEWRKDEEVMKKLGW